MKTVHLIAAVTLMALQLACAAPEPDIQKDDAAGAGLAVDALKGIRMRRPLSGLDKEMLAVLQDNHQNGTVHSFTSPQTCQVSSPGRQLPPCCPGSPGGTLGTPYA